MHVEIMTFQMSYNLWKCNFYEFWVRDKGNGKPVNSTQNILTKILLFFEKIRVTQNSHNNLT
jgi:DNA modification methylase